MKVATFNINGIVRRLDNLLEWLSEAQPDVVCLQEIKCHNSEFPARALEAAGYGAIWKGQGPHHGVAMLARDTQPIETRRALPGDDADREARYLEAGVEGMLIACLYAPNGNPQPGPKFDYKLAWLERLIAHAASLIETGLPVLLVGDYNVVPTDFDLYPSRSMKNNALVQPAPRAKFTRLLDQGWIDALRTLHPEEPMYTFWDYLRDAWRRDAGMRLDHLLLCPEIAARLSKAGVDREVRGREKSSDHAPAWIQLSE
jgi:exodeoxyribonuclease III